MLLGLLVFVFVIVCLLLIVVILLQSSKGEGLASSAFGGLGGQAIFGGRGAATFLSKLTTYLAIAFMVLSLLLAKFYGEERGPTIRRPAASTETTTESTAATEGATAEGASSEEAASTPTTTSESSAETSQSSSESASTAETPSGSAQEGQ